MNITVSRIFLIIVSYVLAYYFSWHFGSLYFAFFHGLLGGGFFPDDAAKSLMGISLALIALIVFLVAALGGTRKYWWIGISLIPAILFEITIDPIHIYFPVTLGLIAWGLGTLAHKALTKFAPSFMAKIS